jgi:hypothetical protein
LLCVNGGYGTEFSQALNVPGSETPMIRKVGKPRPPLIPTALISDRSAGVGPLVLSLGLARGRKLAPLGNPARDTNRPK